MPDEESRRRDDSFISSGSGWLYLPKAVCGQPKERVNHHVIHNTYVSDVPRIGKSSHMACSLVTVQYITRV